MTFVAIGALRVNNIQSMDLVADTENMASNPPG